MPKTKKPSGLREAIEALRKEFEALAERVSQVDRQSRCTHVWEPDRENARKWVCATCGGEDLRRH